MLMLSAVYSHYLRARFAKRNTEIPCCANLVGRKFSNLSNVLNAMLSFDACNLITTSDLRWRRPHTLF